MGWSYHERRSGEDWLSFGVMALNSEHSVPPGEEVQVRLRITLCLKEGTPAGEYPILLETAELTDAETGLAIVPRLTGGTLVVEEAVARAGTRLPDGTRLKRSKIRGVVSEGMICSSRELALGDEHEGILVLASDAPVGAPLSAVIDGGARILEVTTFRS